MSKPVTPSEQLMFSTVRLQIKKEKGVSVGTGFLYHHKIDEDRFVPLLITNKHVVEGGKSCKFTLHEGSVRGNNNFPTGNFSDVILDMSSDDMWVMHPDGNIDLCALRFKIVVDTLNQSNKEVYYCNLEQSHIPDDDYLTSLSAIENIVMVGYPIGLYDKVNNFPLIRKGITSSHPATDFNGESKGVIDAACFAGSSGSPVCILNEGDMYFVKGQGFSGGNFRFKFLGVLYAGPYKTEKGKIKVQEIPTSDDDVKTFKQMINLGYYIKAKEIKRLAEHIVKKDGIL